VCVCLTSLWSRRTSAIGSHRRQSNVDHVIRNNAHPGKRSWDCIFISLYLSTSVSPQNSIEDVTYEDDIAKSVCTITFVLQIFFRSYSRSRSRKSCHLYELYVIRPVSFYHASYASAVYAVIVCPSVRLSVCLSVRPSVCHKSEFYKDG